MLEPQSSVLTTSPHPPYRRLISQPVNRQLPILPGRLQPSTFGLYVLNYCVRNGNRWNHVGITTGYSVERLLSQNYTEEVMCFEHFSLVSQALGILVLVRFIPHGTSTPNLSTLSSSRCLTSLCCEKPHLKAGFTLRCFQRLSLPNAATQLYGWRHNWYTVGSSTPVLSY